MKKVQLEISKKPFRVFEIKENRLKLLAVYSNVTTCSSELNISRTKLYNVLRTKHGVYLNYKFQYILNTSDKRKNKKNKKVFHVYDLNGSYVGSWYNKTNCAKKFGVSADGIIKCLNGKLKTTGNYRFNYIKD